jgi:hypothetical protein
MIFLQPECFNCNQNASTFFCFFVFFFFFLMTLLEVGENFYNRLVYIKSFEGHRRFLEQSLENVRYLYSPDSSASLFNLMDVQGRVRAI